MGVPEALAEAVARVGDRWTILLVAALLDGPRRFNDLLEDLEGIAPTVLTQRLRQLEQSGVVVAVPYSRRPPRSVYQLTAVGQGLAGTLRMLSQWGSELPGPGPTLQPDSDDDATARHEACGTVLETRWYCPTCARTADEPGTEEQIRYL